MYRSWPDPVASFTVDAGPGFVYSEMFIGHYAMALGAKPFAPRVSLGVLFLACQLADLIWPTLVLLGIESFEVDPGNTVMTPLAFVHYPWSHSLVALILWGAILAGIYAWSRGASRAAAVAIAALVVSHWVLDFVTHRPDMPIVLSDSMRVGLGLWNLPVVGVTVEVLLFGTGLWLYFRQTRALNRRGAIGLWTLVGFLLLIYAANLLGPPPPSVAAVTWSAQALWLVVAWGFWIDRNRAARIER